MNPEARLIEIFPSIQGEGAYVGAPQLFIRFHGCSLHCAYCDTPATHAPLAACNIFLDPFADKGNEPSCMEPNPISPERLSALIDAHFPQQRFFSLTGGEPLEQADFLAAWLPVFKRVGNRKILLETAGVHVEAFKRVAPYIDVVSMDIKLKSSTRMDRDFFGIHRRFLEVASEHATHCETYVKVVLDAEMTSAEQSALVDLMSVFPRLEYYLQPVTPVTREALRLALALVETGLSRGMQIRCLPQLHPLIGLM